MSKSCQVTGKQTMVGNNRSHANNATKRTFKSNLQKLKFKSDLLGREFTLLVSTSGLRTLIKHGGLDAFITSKPISRLTDTMAEIKTAILKKTGALPKASTVATKSNTKKPNRSARLVKKTTIKDK